MRSALNGIMREVGVPPSADAVADLSAARAATPEERARRRVAGVLRDERALRREAADAKARGRDCGWL